MELISLGDFVQTFINVRDSSIILGTVVDHMLRLKRIWQLCPESIASSDQDKGR